MKITFNNAKWNIKLWDPDKDSLEFIRDEFEGGVDTEYKPRNRGDQSTETAVAGFAWPLAKISHVVWYTDIPEYLRRMDETDPDIPLYMFNAPVDLQALDVWNNCLWRKLWSDDYQIRDLMVRMPLYEIRTGVFPGYEQGLGDYVKKYLQEELGGKSKKKDSGQESIQTSYHRDMELTDQHILYAGKDPIATVELGRLIPDQNAEHWDIEKIKSQSFWVLHQMGETGYPVDFKTFAEYRRNWVKKGYKSLEYLCDWGLWPGKTSTFMRLPELADLISDQPENFNPEEFVMGGSTLEQNRILKAFERNYDIKFPRSEKTKEKVSVKGDALYYPFLLNDIKPHPLVDHIKNYSHCDHIIGNFLNKDRINYNTGRMHTRFIPIRKNGRTSSKDPNMQNLPQDGIREIFKAPDGCVILVIDVSQGELCTLAQSNYNDFGFSVMRDKINEGLCLHTEFAKNRLLLLTGVRFEDLSKAEFKKKYRQRAKPCNFGFSGGMGIPAFINYARATYGVQFEKEEAKQAKEGWLEDFPENRYHLKPVPDHEWTLRVLKTNLKNEGVPIRDANSVTSVDSAALILSDLGWSDKEVSKFKMRSSRYKVKTYHGAIKTNCTYTEACNYKFSRPLADCMSYAMDETAKMGLPPVMFVHDELHWFLKNDCDLQKNIALARDTMKGAIQEMVPDVTISVECQLMDKWYKNAKENDYDEVTGNLRKYIPARKTLEELGES